MHRIDHATATPDQRFTEGDPMTPTAATVVTADWLNMVQEELIAVAEKAGIPPDKADTTQLRQAILALIAAHSAKRAYRVTEFRSWYEKYPPPGWAIRNGGVLLNAQTHYPALWAALHQPENAWKLITEDKWQAMSAAAPWNGIGGAPYFVLDAEAGTVRLPDTRGMYAEDAGFDGLEVGGVHGDAIRNLRGELNADANPAAELLGDGVAASGVFVLFGKGAKFGIANVADTAFGQSNMTFDASRVVPVANKNQPRAFGILPCVYIGDEQ